MVIVRINLIVGLCILGYLIYTFDAEAILASIFSANLSFLFAAVLVYAVTFVVLAVRWRFVLRRMDAELPLGKAYQAFAGGMFLSDVTPARLGDLGRAYLVKNYIGLERGVASLIVDRYFDILTILILSTTGLVLLGYEGILEGEGPVYLLISLSGFALIFLTGTLLLWLKRKNATAIAVKLGKRAESITRFFSGLDESIDKIKNPKGVLFFGCSITFIAWTAHALRVSLILHSLGSSMPFPFLLFLLPMVSALSLIPISPAGLGVVELGAVAMFSLFGIPPSLGMSIALLDRAITVSFHAFAGLKSLTR